jgi:rhomboid protease GluP
MNRLTDVLLGLNILIYMTLAYLSWNLLEVDRIWILKFGLTNQAFFEGAYWQILTNLFVHFDLPHLGYNMIFLFFFGSKCEEIYGGRRFLGLYILCGLLSSLVSFAYPPGTVSAGSSGAIYGVLGATLVAQRNLYTGGMKTSMLYGAIFFILAAATGFLAHLLGLILGFSMGFLITKDWYPPEEETEGLEYEAWPSF